MADTLDSIVKGAPVAMSGSAASSGAADAAPPGRAQFPGADPLVHTPSSPSMIYLNLLILEASLRAQYLELRARRRHHTFFLTLLTVWICGFGYALLLAPREDGSGVGGSVYWMVESAERLCLLGGVVTAVLVWATGIWERGVRWPRRWLTVSNRGLRVFNCKLVVMRRPWWRETLSMLAWFLSYLPCILGLGLGGHGGVASGGASGSLMSFLFSSSSSSASSTYRLVDPATVRDVDRDLGLASPHQPSLPMVNEDKDEDMAGHEEDLSPGGDHVKLLLMAKPFSAAFRENWEMYRSEYWERENERRALLRERLKERDRRLLRRYGGWFWWLPWRQIPVPAVAAAASAAAERHGLQHPRHATMVSGEHGGVRRARSGSLRRGSVSTTSASRMSMPVTPTTDAEDSAGGGGGGSGGGGGAWAVGRRASIASNASEKRRKKLGGSGSLRGPQNRPRLDGRSITPENPSPLAKQASFTRNASSGHAGL